MLPAVPYQTVSRTLKGGVASPYAPVLLEEASMKHALSLVFLCAFLTSATDAAQTLESPRVNALQDAIPQGSRDAVDSFWQEVSATGAPLIERTNERRPYVLVTFLWR